jgi:serine protease
MPRALAAALLLAAATLVGTSAAAGGPARGLIVKLKDAPTHEQAQGLREHPDAVRWRRVLDGAALQPRQMRAVGAASQLLSFDRTLSAHEAAALADALRRRPEVEWVVPNERERRLQAVPNDPGYRALPGSGFSEPQWWLQSHSGSDANALEDRRRGVPGFPAAWATSGGTGAASARVAVLDTGITSHPELSGRVLPGYDFVSVVEYANDGNGRDADPSDPGDWVSQDDLADPAFDGCSVEPSSWHGTVIAGQIAGQTNNLSGVAGINWNGRIVPVRVAGKCGADVVDIVDGMRWAAGLAVFGAPLNPNPARIVNISFGGSDPCNAAYQSAVDDLLAAGAVVVAAAGNESGTPTRPASCVGVIGVAALNRDGFKASYSNFGTGLAVAAVGGDPQSVGSWGPYVGDSGLLSTDNSGARGPGTPTYSYVAGTSFSAPVVSGVASLMLSVAPDMTAAEIRQGLRTSARPHVRSPVIGNCSDANPGRCICSTSTCGAGIVDAARALQWARGQTLSALSAERIDNDEVRAAAALGADQPGTVPPPPDDGSGGGGGGGGGGDGWPALAWLAGLWWATRALASAPRRG